MTDEEAIRQLFARYAHSADDGRMAEVVALYASDGVMDLAGMRVESREKARTRRRRPQADHEMTAERCRPRGTLSP
jgi:hypothetical protein